VSDVEDFKESKKGKKSKKRTSRSRSGEKNKNNDDPELVKERDNISKWLLSSSDMSPESQRKFLMMMGVKKEAIHRNFDLIEAEKQSMKFRQ
jgi:hypothetical protein